MPKCNVCADTEVDFPGSDAGSPWSFSPFALGGQLEESALRRKKSGEPSAKKKTATSKGRGSSEGTTPDGSDVPSGSVTKGRARMRKVKVTRKLKGGGVQVTKEPIAKPMPKKKAPKKKPKLARKVGADRVTKLNPNGRKYIGPGGSPRGIRQDGKPRRKPGTNRAKSKEAAAFGKKIAKARKKLGLKQWEVAKKAGLSQPGYANIERGVAGTTEETRKAILKALKIGAGK
jgi:DNA-binding XRE family transcriptional regulator